MGIRSIQAYRVRATLRQPYHTAFGDLEWFDATIAVMETENGSGAGESAAVTGYSWESPDDVWRFVQTRAPRLIGSSEENVRRMLDAWSPEHPFGVTPLSVALEMAQGACPPEQEDGRYPLAGILNATTLEEIPPLMDRLVEQGFSTIKCKIGLDVDRDIRRTRLAQSCLAGRARLRLDANQHYSREDARRFVRAVPPDGVELLEQPFPADDWDSVVRFKPECPFPLMLDESIYGEEDILRARDARCADFIKLKLAKAGGLAALRRQAALVREGGMGLVMGNGVATDLSCWQETRVALELARDSGGGKRGPYAGEMNGYLKLEQPLLGGGLGFSRGDAVLKAGRGPLLDQMALRRHAVDFLTWSC